ncbi:hypothetical protein ACFE04_018093 [Oxalis oulophora]
MLTCIARSKQSGDDDSLSQPDNNVKSITSQLKDMALKASGAYRHCNPCTTTTTTTTTQSRLRTEFETESDRFNRAFKRSGSSGSGTPRTWGKEMEARLKVISSGETTPNSVSGRRVEPPVVFVEESEPKEWVAQVEPGVLITFVSLPRGGNDLKRIRFSREMFNKFQAQRWWAENFDKVMELYNVQRLNHNAVPLPTTPRSEDESMKIESSQASPATPPLTREHLPRNLHRLTGLGYSSSDSLDHHHHNRMNSRPPYSDSTGLTSTPKLSSISGATKTEISSMDASIRSSSSRDAADRSDEMSISNASDIESEWVEQDEPGVYITVRALPGVVKNLERCMQEYGGKKTVPEYTGSTCERAKAKTQWPALLFWVMKETKIPTNTNAVLRTTQTQHIGVPMTRLKNTERGDENVRISCFEIVHCVCIGR